MDDVLHDCSSSSRRADRNGARTDAAHELEDVMLAFLEKRVDMLVSTKIIESGLDIPNVNTIIINRADHFGMAELYQLRGRVGRSNVQAYAYLLTPPLSVLGKTRCNDCRRCRSSRNSGPGSTLRCAIWRSAVRGICSEASRAGSSR